MKDEDKNDPSKSRHATTGSSEPASQEPITTSYDKKTTKKQLAFKIDSVEKDRRYESKLVRRFAKTSTLGMLKTTVWMCSFFAIYTEIPNIW